MSFTSGTATSHNDLLDKLRLYLVAEGWTELAWAAGATVADSSVLSIRGPGAGAGKQVFINIRTLASVTAGYYSWEMRGAVDYDGAALWGGQPSESPGWSFFNLWDDAIDYWFYVNDRRFIVVAKVSTNYMSCHGGFILPWGTPADYPFPVMVGGDYFQQREWSFNNSARRHFLDPGGSSIGSGADFKTNMSVRSAGGVWYSVANQNQSSQTNNGQGAPNGSLRGFLWPYTSGGSGGSIGLQHYPLSWGGGLNAADAGNAFESLVPTQQDERPLLPTMICLADQAPLGVIDGAYMVGGTGLVTEQLITIGARNFRAFQNIQRNSPDDFFCVEEV